MVDNIVTVTIIEMPETVTFSKAIPAEIIFETLMFRRILRDLLHTAFSHTVTL